jgi:hypothetical protein
METFRLVSKITAKHLYARLQGKPARLEKTKPAAAKVDTKPEPEPEPAPSAAAAQNPFADSVPFPDSQIDSSYDGMEEVSLEQLLSEGRERPTTMSGNVALPVDMSEVEELDEETIVPIEETPMDVTVTADESEPPVIDDDRISVLEGQVHALEAQLDSMREEQRVALEEILRDLEELTSRVRKSLD